MLMATIDRSKWTIDRFHQGLTAQKVNILCKSCNHFARNERKMKDSCKNKHYTCCWCKNERKVNIFTHHM